MSAPSAASISAHPLLRVVVYGAAIVLALLHVFVTFRGLSSAAGMEQAQLAREIARGHGYQTKVLRPYALARLGASGREVAPAAMPEITQPPLQPLLWAPLFKALERHHVYESAKGGSIYLLDRAVACLGAAGFLLTLLWTHGAARRLFDDTVAGVAVLCLLVCEPLWQLSVSGSPVALLLPLFALCFRCLVSAQEKLQEGQGIIPQALLIGLLGGLMILTHWLAVWLVAGLVLACAFTLPGRKGAVVVVTALPVLALSGWCWWLTRTSGDLLGGAKPLFQAHLLTMDVSLLQREYSLSTPPVQVDDLLRKLAQNWRHQLAQGYAYLGLLAPAVFFAAALLHRFRRPETARACHALGIILVVLALGLGMLGLPDKTEDDNALYIVLAPAMAVFGSAMLALLWTRLQGSGATSFWARLGFGVIAVGLSALPMAAELPAHIKAGLVLRSRIHPHWPPYVPDRVALVRKLMEPDEVVFADVPWFVAWYADVPAVMLPVKRTDFNTISGILEGKGAHVAGVIVTPYSSRVGYLHETFSGAYSEWTDLIFRGPMLALDREFTPNPEFKYKLPLPLVAFAVGAKENISMQMTFYTDKVRSLKK
jgi:hypothetical protein